MARDVALRVLSTGRRIDAASGWVRMPYYHHVFERERAGFAAQLDYLKQFGEFISLDEAVSLLAGDVPIDGRYFCIGFDDGFKSCITGALPLLAERSIPATFYVVTDLIGRSLALSDPTARDVFGVRGPDGIEFLSWDDCRAMIAAGMTIGSHTATHIDLAQSESGRIRDELISSKATIERETTHSCTHFCAPYGTNIPGGGAQLLRDSGYRSSATGARGANRRGSDVFSLRRDHLIATWGLHQLRYFLSA